VPLEVRTHSAHYPALSSTRTRVGLASHEQKSQVRGKKPPAARLLTAPNPRCLFPPALPRSYHSPGCLVLSCLRFCLAGCL
jgi:hypothetical protein